MNLPELLPFFDSWKRIGNGKFVAQCPMPNHRDSDPSVTITQDVNTGNILMMCWGCNTKAPQLVQALGLHISDLFGDPGHPAAVQQEIQVSQAPEEEVEKLADYTVITRDNLTVAKDYILTRFGLSEDGGYSLSLGVDTGESGINRPQSCTAFNSGVPHLIIPFKDPDGSLVGMQGRRLVDGEPRWRSVSGPGWSKIGCFGWNLDGPVIITEGPSDALAVVGLANLPAIAIRGASNTDENTCAQIKEWLNGRSAIVIGDNGEAGEKFASELSSRLGINSCHLPDDYSDLCEFLGAGGILSDILSSATETEAEKVVTPAEEREALKERIRHSWPDVIDDQDLIEDLVSFRIREEEHYNLIFTSLRRDRNLCQTVREFDEIRNGINSRVNRTPPPAGGGGNNHHGGHGQPLPNQPVILWDPSDQLHVTERHVRTAMDAYDGRDYYRASPGQYVKVVEDDLINLKDAGQKSMLSQMGHWRVMNGQQERGHVPQDAARMVSDPSWECKLPIIKRRVEVPFMLENGDIVSTPGFHEDSGIYLLPRDKIAVPEVPLTVSDEDVSRAAEIFKDVIEGFKFTNPASKTNLLAMTLTSPLREIFRDNPMVPLLTSTAPQSGSGKGTSIRLPLSTAGVGPYSLATTAYNADENEFEKKLVGKLLKKSTFIFLDNIRSQVNSAVLEQMLTAANYDGRTLGHSEVNSLSTLVLWVCTLQSTGSFNRDLTRRCVPVELTKNWMGHWTHKNIESYLADMRGDLIWACFVVARRWMDMGKPLSATRLDGYTGWVESMGGILEHVLGYGEFLDNVSSFRKTQDEISSTVDGLLERWLIAYGEEIRPARMAVSEVDDPALHQLLNLRGNPPARQVINALERLLTSQHGYIIGVTHKWEYIGTAPYKHEGMKKLFRCVPLEEEN